MQASAVRLARGQLNVDPGEVYEGVFIGGNGFRAVAMIQALPYLPFFPSSSFLVKKSAEKFIPLYQ